jgi:transcriptional regulator with XRE-family HTH domain
VFYLKFRRIELNLTCREVAKQADINNSWYGQIERGRVNPTPAELKRIGKALKCAPERLMVPVDPTATRPRRWPMRRRRDSDEVSLHDYFTAGFDPIGLLPESKDTREAGWNLATRPRTAKPYHESGNIGLRTGVTGTAPNGVLVDVDDDAPEASRVVASSHPTATSSATKLASPVARRRLCTWWNDALSAASVKDLHLHDLRAEAASQLSEAGASDKDVRDALGHSNTSMTSAYLRSRRTSLRDAYAKRARKALRLAPVRQSTKQAKSS